MAMAIAMREFDKETKIIYLYIVIKRNFDLC